MTNIKWAWHTNTAMDAYLQWLLLLEHSIVLLDTRNEFISILFFEKKKWNHELQMKNGETKEQQAIYCIAIARKMMVI